MRRAGNAVSVASPGEEPPRGASLGFRHKERTALTRGARSSALLSGKALSGLPLPAIAILRHLGVSPTQPGRASLASSAVIYRRATGCTLPPRLRIPYVGISGRIWNPSTALVPASRRGDGWNFAEKTHGVRRILLLCAGHAPAGGPQGEWPHPRDLAAQIRSATRAIPARWRARHVARRSRETRSSTQSRGSLRPSSRSKQTAPNSR